MIIAEFTIDHPVLLEPLRSVPDIEMIWETTYERPDAPPQMLVWLVCDDFEAAEAALEADPAAGDPQLLTELDDRRLYRVTFTDIGDATNLMPRLMAVGAVLLEATGTRKGWTCRARFPDRAALDHLYQFCRSHDIPFTLDRLYDQTDWHHGDEVVEAVTEKQREVLRLAHERGYFAVPAETDLQSIATELDISKQAVSSRLKRGLDNLLGSTPLADR